MDGDTGRSPASVIRPVAVAGGALLAFGSLSALAAELVGSRGGAAALLDDVKGIFWANQELNLWTWFSTLLLAALAAAFALTAVLHRDRGLRYADLVIFAATAAWLSADEAAALHERLGTVARAFGVGGLFEWVVIGLPVAVAAVGALAVIARRTDPRLRRHLGIAAVVFLGGAVGLEIVAGLLVETWGLSRSAPLFILEVTLEEGMEVAGALIALHAVLTRLRVVRGPDRLAIELRERTPASPASAPPAVP